MRSYLEQYVFSGGFMMLVLAPTSLLALGWIIRGFVRLRRSRVAPEALIEGALALEGRLEARDFQESLSRDFSPLARLALHLLRLGVVGPDAKSAEEENEHLRPVLNDEIDRLYQETAPLATIYAVAPLMGLLGTVIGMIRTFQEFTTNPEHSIASLSQGINEALVTTMWGLIIAIPAYIFVQIFRQRVFRYEKELLPLGAKRLALIVWEKGKEAPRKKEW